MRVLQLEERRSVLCKAVFSVIETMSREMPGLFDEQLCSIIWPCVVKLLPVTVKIIADAAHQTALKFVPILRQSIPLILQGISPVL